MPYDGSAGYGRGTSDKQILFRRLVRAHLSIARAVMKRNEDWACQVYQFIDLNAGPGVVKDEPGSPLIFVEEAMSKGSPFWGWFCEQDKYSAAKLRVNLDCSGPAIAEHSQVLALDNREAVKDIAGWLRDAKRNVGEPFGLIYADPNGTVLPIEAIKAITEEFRKIDVLVHVSAANYKRFRCVFGERFPHLFDDLDKIGKSTRFLSPPRGHHQWAFVLLTNWDDYNGEIKAIGFYNEKTFRGQAQQEILNLTTKERKQRGQQGFEW